MEDHIYPLLCWQADPASVYGILLGPDLELVDRNDKRLRSTMSDHIRRTREREGHFPDPEIQEARLKVTTVDVRLAYRTDQGNFPVPGVTPFAVAAVYGRNPDAGYAKCYLPYLQREFYYYDDEQLPVLIEHFTRDCLDGLTPEVAQRYQMPSTPWLEKVTVPRTQRPRQQQVPRYLKEAYEGLSGVAERLPAERAVRRRLHVFPEAAWEQGVLTDQLAERLLGEGNFILVGEPGVGKSVVLLEALRKAHQRATQQDAGTGRRLPAAKRVTFWRSKAERLIGRAEYLGEWQALCDQLVQWLEHANGVLWITDFLSLLYTGGQGPEDSMAAYLLPALQRGRIRLVGEANPTEYETAKRLLPGFIECFEPVLLPEMETARSRRVVELFAAYAKSTLNVDIAKPALDTGYRLLARHVRYESFPGKAIRFFGDCVRHALAEHREALGEADIVARFAHTTGLPERFLRDDQPLGEGDIHPFFASRIFGQPAAVEQLKTVVYTFKAALNDPDKPIATLLFAGPTGVGKTAAAKALAEYFFGAAGGRSDPLFRVDMSEFQYAFQIARLIGDAQRPGKLVEHVRTRPFSVILLDEIEKADGAIFDLLLTLLDEGRLRDGHGRITDFRGTIVVMTTNLGVRYGASLGFADGAAAGETAEHDIRRFFRPEFFNRIDRVVPFDPLSQDAVASIAAKELAAIAHRDGIHRRGLQLHFTPAVSDFVAQVGFSPKYGARPLQRMVEQHVVGAIAKALLGGMVEGAEVWVDVREGAVVVEVK